MTKKKTFQVKRILIPHDFSDTALMAVEHGGFMAELFKAEIVLLHVIENKWQSFNLVDAGVNINDLSKFTDKAAAKMQEVAESIRKTYGVKSSVQVVVGNIFNEIVKASQEFDTDLIVMGTHGSSGIHEFFVGSNTYKVVTMSSSPVISVHTHPEKKGFKNICLPIDMSAHTLQKVSYALEIAEKYGSKINVLGVLSPGEESPQFDLKLEKVVELIKSHGVTVECKTISGRNQAKMTLDFVNENKCDMVVIMTDQEENLSGRFIGPYAQQIVNHSKVAVLSVHPEVKGEMLESTHPWG